MEESSNPVSPATEPFGSFDSHCDDKGRVRLPKELEAFARTLPVQQFFVTTLDEDTGRIYPLDVWRNNEKILADYTEEPEAAEDIAFLAHYWGQVSTLDAQGRILVPTELRRKLGIENQRVHLRYFNSVIEIYSDEVAQKRRSRALESAQRNKSALRKQGMK